MTMLKLSQPNISESAIQQVADVLRSGNLVCGAEARAFETELAKFTNSRNAVLVSSGTAALYLAMVGLEIGPGDIVIVPAFTFPATVNAVIVAGARPLIVDVDPKTYCLDPSSVSQVIQSFNGPGKLRAILLVHEFGTPCDMVQFRDLAARHKLLLLEDAACALGASSNNGPIGSGSTLACFSFHPRKTITTGEGGLLTTDDSALADRLKMLRNHGRVDAARGIDFVEAALNFRLTDFQAALGRSQLHNLSAWIEKRRQLALEYMDQLQDLCEEGLLELPEHVSGQSWQTFMVVLADKFDRDVISQQMKTNGIEAGVGAQALGDMSAYRALAEGDLPVSRRLSNKGLALPMCELMSVSDVSKTCNALAQALREVR